jgi:hypothetical protein
MKASIRAAQREEQLTPQEREQLQRLQQLGRQRARERGSRFRWQTL